MDWKPAIAEERAALARIAGLLCALACLAERAASRSPVVCGFVIWLLRHVEAAARDLVADDLAAPPSTQVVPAGGCPADAMRLAVSLRALARQLHRQARWTVAVCRADRGEADPPPSGRPRPVSGGAVLALFVPAASAFRVPGAACAPDTS